MTLPPIDELRALLKAITPGEWTAGRSDMMSYDASGTVAFKNIYADDPRGGTHNGDPVPLTVAKAVDESALYPTTGAQALPDSEIHANARAIALLPALLRRVVELEAALRRIEDAKLDWTVCAATNVERLRRIAASALKGGGDE